MANHKIVMKKVLLTPINALVWTLRNPAETMLLSIFAFSMLPFFMHVASPAMLGGFMAFFACISEKYVFKYEKPTKLYVILSAIVLTMGAVAMFVVGGKEYKSIWTTTDNLLSTYQGAFYGIMIAHFLISFLDKESAERQRRREERMAMLERERELRIIAQKEKDGFIAIKKDGKIVGYVEKEKYDLFVKENIKNEN